MKNLLKKIQSLFKKQKNAYIAIDLGTANTLVYLSNQGIIFNQPTIIAYNQTGVRSILAFGNKAFEMMGKSHSGINLVSPLSEGVISDLDATHDFIKAIFKNMELLKIWKNANVILSCPPQVSALQRNSLKQLALSLGNTKVIVEEEIKLAAIGAGIDIKLPVGNLIVDIGGGTTDVAVISANGIVAASSIRVAGNFLDREINKFLRKKHNIAIGLKNIIELKHAISNLEKSEHPAEFTTFGQDITKGTPREIVINSEEIRPLLSAAFEQITELILEVISSIDGQLSNDIIKNGVVICGGGALIKGIDTYLNNKLKLKVTIAFEPLNCVINGSKAIENIFLKN